MSINLSGNLNKNNSSATVNVGNATRDGTAAAETGTDEQTDGKDAGEMDDLTEAMDRSREGREK